MIEINEQTKLIFELLNKFRIMTKEQIIILSGYSDTYCRKRLDKLIRMGYLGKEKTLGSKRTFYFLKKKCMKHLEPIKTNAPKFNLASIDHELYVVDYFIILSISKNVSVNKCLTERDIQMRELGNMGAHKPDLIYEVDGVLNIVEIEKTPKQFSRFLNNIRKNYTTGLKQTWIIPGTSKKLRVDYSRAIKELRIEEELEEMLTIEELIKTSKIIVDNKVIKKAEKMDLETVDELYKKYKNSRNKDLGVIV